MRIVLLLGLAFTIPPVPLEILVAKHEAAERLREEKRSELLSAAIPKVPDAWLESRREAWAKDVAASPAFLKVFEHVAGARIAGRAAPGARVSVALPLRTNRRRELVYRAHTIADESGRYALRVPYANQGSPRAVRVGPHYTLHCRSDSAPLAISESEIQSGAEVVGPDLCR